MKTALNVVSLLLLFFLFLIPEMALARKWPVAARHGMVVSTERLASEVGARILEQGGNAVDAAVATGFALAVVHPAAGNIGGGGFMVIRFADGSTTAIDYREKAPKAASKDMYLDENGELVRDLNHHSYLAVGVPGTVAGLTLALEKFGSLSLQTVIEPAIELAESGFIVPYSLSKDITYLAERFRKYPASAAVFLKPDSSPYQPGERFFQKDLAQTLKRVAEKGRDGFYKGKTAELIEQDMKANAGLITRTDLDGYEAVVRTPVKTTYRDYEIIGMPPPSSGGITLAIMLNILEGYHLKEMGHNSAAYIHLVAESMRRAFSARAQHLGDPDFNPGLAVERLISKEFAADLRATIDLEKAGKSSPTHFDWGHESTETTHFSVVDMAGNAVSNTYTIEHWYGTKIVAAGAGFLYNNEMGDFNPWPGRTDSTGLVGTPPNLIMPEKRMLSSMTPTIIAKDGKTVLVVGSPGGRTIINSVLETVLNVTDFEMNVYDAVDQPRFHHQWLPDKIWFEDPGFSTDTISLLKEMGHRVAFRNTQGRTMAIFVDQENGWLWGAADARSPNRAAVGY